MPREIKFRAWDKQEKQMISADNFYFSDEFEPFKDSVEKAQDSFEIMQFTGLKDKNGTDIYEGDFLRYGSLIGIVVFTHDHCAFESATEESTKPFWSYHEHCEIIGNVYEPPKHLAESK